MNNIDVFLQVIPEGVAAAVTRRPRPRVLPALLPTLHHLGVFVLDLPVTTAEARDLGRIIYGLPKFVAGMTFHEALTTRAATVSEGDAEVLTLSVRPSGPVMTDRAPVVLYSVRDGQLMTTAPFFGHRQMMAGRRAGHLSLGTHPVAERLRGLSVSGDALIVFNYLDAHLVLPVGEPIAPARNYTGYLGGNGPRGRLTVQYPGSAPVDQYAIPPGMFAEETLSR